MATLRSRAAPMESNHENHSQSKRHPGCSATQLGIAMLLLDEIVVSIINHPVTPRSHVSLAASLWALCLVLIAAGLVFLGEWTPWEAMMIVAAGAVFMVLIGLASLMLIAGNQSNRARLWNIFVHTVKADLQPFVDLWKLLRGPRR